MAINAPSAVSAVTVPDLVGMSVLDAAAALRSSGLVGVYINKAGETSHLPPLGRRVEAQYPVPEVTVPARGDVVVYTT